LNIQNFWRRWHITLSRFLKDYIYIPLGGNKKGTIKTYNNLMITFIIGGIWHGAGWTFIFWGFLHGFALIIHRIWNKLGFRLYSWIAWIITFNFVNITWIFFRAKEWDDAIKVLSSMFTLNLDDLFNKNIVLSNNINFIILFFIIIILFPNTSKYKIKYLLTHNYIFVFLIFYIITFLLLHYLNIYSSNYTLSEFLYFNF